MYVVYLEIDHRNRLIYILVYMKVKNYECWLKELSYYCFFDI